MLGALEVGAVMRQQPAGRRIGAAGVLYADRQAGARHGVDVRLRDRLGVLVVRRLCLGAHEIVDRTLSMA